MDRARMLHGMEVSGAVGDLSGALDSSSLDSCSSVVQDADDAMSESSWTSLAKRKEREREAGGRRSFVRDRKRICGS